MVNALFYSGSFSSAGFIKHITFQVTVEVKIKKVTNVIMPLMCVSSKAVSNVLLLPSYAAQNRYSV
jgi:hypothetical protein